MSDQPRAGVIRGVEVPEDQTTHGPRRPIMAAVCPVAAIAFIAAPVAGVYLNWFEEHDRTAIPIFGVMLAIIMLFHVSHHWTGAIYPKKPPEPARWETRFASAAQFLAGLAVAVGAAVMLYNNGLTDNAATYGYFALAVVGLSMMAFGFWKWR